MWQYRNVSSVVIAYQNQPGSLPFYAVPRARRTARRHFHRVRSAKAVSLPGLASFKRIHHSLCQSLRKSPSLFSSFLSPSPATLQHTNISILTSLLPSLFIIHTSVLLSTRSSTARVKDSFLIPIINLR